MNRNAIKQFRSIVPKYRAIPTVIDGKKFASKKEAKRYTELKILNQIGEIHGLRLQVSFSLEVNGFHVCRYVADFVYFDKSGNKIVEDVKGFLTPQYKLKRKLMKAVFGIEIKET